MQQSVLYRSCVLLRRDRVHADHSLVMEERELCVCWGALYECILSGETGRTEWAEDEKER